MKAKTTILRDFVVECEPSRGGKYLIPIAVLEVVKPSRDSCMDYDVIRSSGYFGDLRGPLEKRGDLIRLKNGKDRITRTPHVGKEVRVSRRCTFVHFKVAVPKYKLFTKWTEDPKLDWLIRKCKTKGLRVFVEGKSHRAPISWVHRDDHDAAWKILGPIDDIPDNAPRFRNQPHTRQ